jgi:hypothetical protein
MVYSSTTPIYSRCLVRKAIQIRFPQPSIHAKESPAFFDGFDAFRGTKAAQAVTTPTEIASKFVRSAEAHNVMAKLHDSMPVILAEADWPKWLGETPATEAELLALLKPCPDEALKTWPVDKAVGNVKNTGPQLAMPLSGNLFARSPFAQKATLAGCDQDDGAGQLLQFNEILTISFYQP